MWRSSSSSGVCVGRLHGSETSFYIHWGMTLRLGAGCGPSAETQLSSNWGLQKAEVMPRFYHTCSFRCYACRKLWERSKHDVGCFGRRRWECLLERKPTFLCIVFICCYPLFFDCSGSTVFKYYGVSLVTPNSVAAYMSHQRSMCFLLGKRWFLPVLTWKAVLFLQIGRKEFSHHQAILSQWNGKVLLKDSCT